MNLHGPMKHLTIIITSVFFCLVSCTTKKQSDLDIALIETIENNLLPPILIKGEVLEEYGI